jgi:5-oxoprolinase (ATP-hydrolysing) subunit A
MMDINCDMGESFGAYRIGNDAAVMPFISSANIACGFHAGDPLVMDATVKLALEHGVSVGAHPGYPDLQGFGRRNMDLTPEEVEAFTLYQVAALAGFARARGVELAHVKPHGALYNQAAKDRALALAIARGVARFSRSLALVGLAGSLLVEMGVEAGLQVGNEAFPDRAYNPDGSLRSRRLPGAVIESPQDALEHALRLAREGIVLVRDGQTVNVRVDTLCIHGDNPAAPRIAQAIRQGLETEGVSIHPLTGPVS